MDKETSVYRITFYNLFYHLWTLMVFAIGLVLYPYVVDYFNPEIDFYFNFKLSMIVLFIFVTPVIVIHTAYWAKNYGFSLMYTNSSKKIEIQGKSKLYSFCLDEIKYVYQFKSPDLAEDRVQWLLWSGYNYSYIVLKNGEQIFISSLLVLDLDLPIEEEKVVLTKTLFPYPWQFKEKKKGETTI